MKSSILYLIMKRNQNDKFLGTSVITIIMNIIIIVIIIINIIIIMNVSNR